MTKRLIIGIGMLCVPFAAIFIFAAWNLGISVAIEIFIFCAALIGWIFASVAVMNGWPKKKLFE
jgi:hypothetical protein